MLLDLGLPLDTAPTADPAPLMPDVPVLRELEAGPLALVLSHDHADHWGLAPHARPSLPVLTGAATRCILLAAAPFVPHAVSLAAQGSELPDLSDRVPLRVGPFTVTPHLVDHSAFDA